MTIIADKTYTRDEFLRLPDSVAYELIDYFTEVGVLNGAFLHTGTECDECSFGFLPLADLCYTQQYIFTWLVH